MRWTTGCNTIEQASLARSICCCRPPTRLLQTPEILEALGNVESDAEGELQLDRFRPDAV